MNVYTLKEAAKGVWFPLRGDTLGGCRDLGRSIGGTPSLPPTRSRTIRSSIRRFSRAEIPVGYNVNDDRRHGRRFYVQMPDGSEQEIHAGEAMPRREGARPRRPDAKD